MIPSYRNRNPLPGTTGNVPHAILLILCAASTFIIGFQLVAIGQQGRREIVSEDFTKPRPTPTPSRH